MKKIAVFPGSFDPLTLGHESLVLRALPLFDEIVIAIGINALKTYYFPLEKRKAWIEKVFKDYPTIKVTTYTGLTVDYCRKLDAHYILRGLRTSADFEFERSIGQVNKKLFPEIETVFLLTTPELTAITSSVIRDVVRNNGDASQFVPEGVDLTI
ncbi:MAG: pantetheine-phosphate adenylyltransferase [Bacteroidales bacterium]|jgi:pantetheine-phosphate adenylyltransferase|nr:pantetheine-phosphate adenylyltransferase [Bacteroidales bacterium]